LRTIDVNVKEILVFWFFDLSHDNLILKVINYRAEVEVDGL